MDRGNAFLKKRSGQLAKNGSREGCEVFRQGEGTRRGQDGYVGRFILNEQVELKGCWREDQRAESRDRLEDLSSSGAIFRRVLLYADRKELGQKSTGVTSIGE